MRHPPAGSAGRGHLSRRWLLIGNSRWHWAEAGPAGWQVHDHPAEAGPAGFAAGGAAPPLAWASVGVLPSWAIQDPGLAAVALPPERRLTLEHIPLPDLPPWLGIDRALAAWEAWRHDHQPRLVADAGTVLSLTRVDGRGRFSGGRLMAGVALQWRAMAAATAALPACGAGGASPIDPWPQQTQAAMVVGVRRGLAAAVAAALQDARLGEPPCRLVLTGGDGADLLPLLRECCDPDALSWRPHLCLEALAALRPQADQPSPRSARI